MSLLLVVVSSHFIVNSILEVSSGLHCCELSLTLRFAGSDLVLGPCLARHHQRYRCLRLWYVRPLSLNILC